MQPAFFINTDPELMTAQARLAESTKSPVQHCLVGKELNSLIGNVFQIIKRVH